jgi:hypothetical protein
MVSSMIGCSPSSGCSFLISFMGLSWLYFRKRCQYEVMSKSLSGCEGVCFLVDMASSKSVCVLHMDEVNVWD